MGSTSNLGIPGNTLGNINEVVSTISHLIRRLSWVLVKMKVVSYEQSGLFSQDKTELELTFKDATDLFKEVTLTYDFTETEAILMAEDHLVIKNIAEALVNRLILG